MPNQSSASAATSHLNLPMSVAATLLSQALDGVPTAVYVKDRQHRWLFANVACCDLLGRSQAQIIETPESAILPATLANQFRQQDETLFQGQPSSIQRVTLVNREGSRLILSRRTELTADGTLLLCFLQPCSEVVTPPSTTAEALPENVPQFQALLANVPAVIYQLCRGSDGQIRCTFVSSGAFEALGIASEVIQANPDVILNYIHPLDRPNFEGILTPFSKSAPWRWEGRYYKPSGEQRWLQTAARLQAMPDGTLVWDGLLMDITSRKQVAAATIEQAVMEQALADNEARFRTIAATIPGALFQLRVQSGQCSIDYVSDRIRDIAGVSPRDIMEDARVLLERIHPLDRDRLQVTIGAAISNISPWQFEGRIITPDGHTRWWHGDAMPLQQPQDGVVFCGVVLDITERKTIEEAYQENERRLRMALNVSGMGVWTWDLASDQMTWTTEPGSLFGSTAATFCDTFESYLQKICSSDRASLRQAMGQSLEQGHDYRIEYRISLGDGTIRWIRERGGPWRDRDGIVIGLMGTVIDITDLKTADAALAESEERYRTLLNNIPGTVYRCQIGKDWTLLFQSEAIADISGYPVDHPIHQEGWRLIHADDRDRVDQETAAAIAQRRPFDVEYRILHADGSIRWVQNTGQPITNITGAVEFIDGVLTDITRRKESETRFRELAQREVLINRISTQIRESLELTPILQTTVQAVRHQLATDRVVVYRFEDDWMGEVVVEAVVSPWQSTLGELGADNCFPSGYANYYESGRVRAIDDIYQAGLDECHLHYLESLQVRASLIVPILLQKRLWGLLIAHECRGVRHWTGSEIELLISLAGQAGIAIGQADLYQRATENAIRARQQAEDLEATLAELQRTQAQLVQTEKMSSLGQLVAGVAHEINNPVSFISGNISHAWRYTQDLLALIQQYQAFYPTPPPELLALIQKIDLEFLAEDFPKLLESMRIGADRIKSIVTSLRHFSRMDEAEIKAVDIHDGLESTLMILQNRLKANGDRPEVRLHRMYAELPPVECYAGQLNQVFMNLISNAIDALEDQMQVGKQQPPPEICIATEQVPPNQVRITIADNGPGISTQKRRRIFEPFYTTKPIGKGTGIGLSISYQIVTERHQGTLNCESQPGEGTTFHIMIPLRQGTT
ncbi:MAG: PAS domain-containing protein [Leptolyngbya sp. SIO1E4]|nr:PAS domain-containing protein [Leptolyngbya sp. SIO1E4]